MTNSRYVDIRYEGIVKYEETIKLDESAPETEN